MEDSEKRKERLKAMRIDAAQVDVSAGVDSSSGHLSNPLAEASTVLSRRKEPHARPRFDYYTDPMSAYSGMRKNNADQQIKQDNVSSPRPTSGIHQIDGNHRHLQTQAHQASSAPYMVPRGMVNLPPPPMGPRGTVIAPPVYQGYSPNTWNGYGPPPGNFAPPGVMRPPHPFPMHQGPPEHWDRYGGRDNHNFPPQPGRVENRPSYDYHPHWSGRNTNPGSGRGRGLGRSPIPSFGRTGGRGKAWDSRGRASSGVTSAESFYDKSMAEDPWQNLKPVLWRSSSKSPVSSDAWLPNSIATKKPRVSDVPSVSNNDTKQSLAEYLAASFEEASRDEPSS